MTKNKLPKLLFCFITALFLSADGFIAAEEIEQFLTKMTFDTEAYGWQEEKNCKLTLEDGNLCIRALGVEPSITRLSDRLGGQISVVIRLRTKKESAVSFYWTTGGSPRRSEDKKIIHTLNNDGEWHDYEFIMSVPDRLISMSLRFSTAEGFWDIASMTAHRSRPHPLSLRKVEDYVLTEDGKQRQMFRLSVYNDLTLPIKVKADNLFRKEKEQVKENKQKYEFWYGIKTEVKPPDDNTEEEPQKPIPPPFEKINEVVISDRETVDFAVPVVSEGHLSAAALTLYPNDFPAITFPVFRYKNENKPEEHTAEEYTLPLRTDWFIDIAADARTARIRQKNNIVAVIAPIVHRSGVIPKFKLKQDSKQYPADGSKALHFESEDTALEIRSDNGRIRFIINSIGENNTGEPAKPAEKLEGPVVRLAGTLQSGIVPGIEFLGKNEVSSSAIDLIEPYNERSVSQADWLTSPFSFCATDKAAVLLQWNNSGQSIPALQPVFSSPNRFDYTDEHRLSLRGTKIDATLDVLPPFSGSDSQGSGNPAAVQILQRYFTEYPFPEPLPPVRTDAEEDALCLKALTSAVQGEDGQSWAYAAEPDWHRKPFADILSSLFRLTGKMPTVKNIVAGGSGIANESSFFLIGKAEQYSKERKAAADSYLTMQNPDGSFFYRTRFPEVEQQFTSFGITAVRALEIMECVRLTGNEIYFTAVQKALGNLSSCDVPRGGFFRETPLHTPDLYSAAAATWLAVWAYEFSKNEEYLKLANRFAVMGLPFVYLHGNNNKDKSAEDRIMLYATVSKFGGEGRRLPLSFGVANPQTGIVYAYAIHLLSKYDKEFDWDKIALGICRTAEAIQYSDENGGDDSTGCIPARFEIRRQKRSSWKVNPCSLISLRAALAGKIDSLSVVSDGKRIYAAPFPLKITSKGLEATDVPEGQMFQVLQNGSRIINAEGSGKIITD